MPSSRARTRHTMPATGNVSSDGQTPTGRFTLENHFWIYSAPVILVFGICANLLTIVVQNRPRFRGTSSRIYLTSLAFGDVTALVVGLTPEWLHQLHVVSLWDVSVWICRLEMYLFYTSLDFAIWTLMLFSCDRFVAVCYPLRKTTCCTPRRAAFACGMAFLVANLNAYVFWTRGAEYEDGTLIGNCRYLPRYRYFELSIRPLVVLFAAFVIPFIVIAISNVIIVVRLTSAERMRKTSVATASGTPGRRGVSQTTAMCLSASIAFLVLVLPSIILFTGKKWWSASAVYPLAKAVAGQLVYIHHSINFALYSLTGVRFRRELQRMCRCTAPTALQRSWSSTKETTLTTSISATSDSASVPLVNAVQNSSTRKSFQEASRQVQS